MDVVCDDVPSEFVVLLVVVLDPSWFCVDVWFVELVEPSSFVVVEVVSVVVEPSWFCVVVVVSVVTEPSLFTTVWDEVLSTYSNAIVFCTVNPEYEACTTMVPESKMDRLPVAPSILAY